VAAVYALGVVERAAVIAAQGRTWDGALLAPGELQAMLAQAEHLITS
jgi:hypothetical protein